MGSGLSFCPGPIGSDSFLNPKWDARPLKQGTCQGGTQELVLQPTGDCLQLLKWIVETGGEL